MLATDADKEGTDNSQVRYQIIYQNIKKNNISGQQKISDMINLIKTSHHDDITVREMDEDVEDFSTNFKVDAVSGKLSIISELDFESLPLHSDNTNQNERNIFLEVRKICFLFLYTKKPISQN